MSSVRGYDNLYRESVNDVALLNYNKGIADRLRLQEQQMQNKLPFKEPQMLGGVRASNSILAGTTVEGPSTLAVGGRAYRTFTGNEKPYEGGVNRLKKANRWLDFSKNAVGDAFGIYDQAIARGAGTGGVNRLKKANRYLDFSKKTVGDAFGIYDQAIARGAGTGGVNRLKKANRYLDFSKKVVGDAFNIYDEAKSRGAGTGGVNRLKKANRYLDFSKKVVGDAFNIYDEAKSRGAGSGGVNRLKKANRYLDFSKKVVGDAFGIMDQAKARGGMVYSQDLKDALMKGCGGAKPKKERKPRVARFEKGSAEAKAWGEKMRQARMNKMK
nr:MAG: hypothetical protein [Lake Baikal virophage 5]WPF46544.1 MAG: hypothetical protein [Lake Baikal virophage 5]